MFEYESADDGHECHANDGSADLHSNEVADVIFGDTVGRVVHDAGVNGRAEEARDEHGDGDEDAVSWCGEEATDE